MVVVDAVGRGERLSHGAGRTIWPNGSMRTSNDLKLVIVGRVQPGPRRLSPPPPDKLFCVLVKSAKFFACAIVYSSVVLLAIY